MTKKAYEILDRPEVLSVLFYPRREVGPARPSANVHAVRIPVGNGVFIGGKIFSARPGDPVILFFHGNGEIASDYDTIAPLYSRLGITLFVVDYRGYGLSDDAPSSSTMMQDAWTCFTKARDVLAENGIQAEKIFVMGRSLGSAAALEIASNTKDGIAGLIIESGFAYTFSLIERIGFLQVADAFEHRDGFCNLEKIGRVDVPTLIIHGERDWIIPIGDAEALHDASAAVEKRFVRIPEAGHNDLMMIGYKAYFDAIAVFCGKPPVVDADTQQFPGRTG